MCPLKVGDFVEYISKPSETFNITDFIGNGPYEVLIVRPYEYNDEYIAAGEDPHWIVKIATPIGVEHTFRSYNLKKVLRPFEHNWMKEGF